MEKSLAVANVLLGVAETGRLSCGWAAPWCLEFNLGLDQQREQLGQKWSLDGYLEDHPEYLDGKWRYGAPANGRK